MEKKKIKFINSKYQTLFEIEDGENIVLFGDGESIIEKCTYIDEYHFKFGNWVYHICEFAEKSEISNKKYLPIKTFEGWKEAKKDLRHYLKVGDLVDEDIMMYFLDVLPPAYCRNGIIQIGEPYSHREGKETYATIQKTIEGWVYKGHCHKGSTINKD